MAIALRAIAYDRFAGCGFTVSGCTVYHGLLLYGLSLIVALRAITLRAIALQAVDYCRCTVYRFTLIARPRVQYGAVLAGRPWMVKYGQWLDLSTTLARDILRSRAYEGSAAADIE